MWPNKIAFKLTFYIILLSALITLLTTFVQWYVYSDDDINLLVSFITNTASILFLAILIGWIFHTQVLSHLHKIADYAKRLDYEHLDTILTLDRPSHDAADVDELDSIVNSINRIYKSYKSAQERAQELHKYAQENQNARAQELHECAQENQNLLYTALIGLGLWRLDGTLVKVNLAYAQIIGCTVPETLKLNYWDDVVVEEDVAAEQAQLQALKVDERYGPLEKEYRHKDGYHVPVKLSALIIEINGENYVWSHVENLSRQKWEIRELQLAKQKAEEANLAKSKFIANMSNELHTCMDTIVGYTEMLEKDLKKYDQPLMLQDIKNVHVTTKQLLGLIDGILDISKIEVGKMPLYSEHFDLKTLIQNTVATIQPLIEKKANALHFWFDENLGEMYSDLSKVRQILFNLLSNAFSFTEQSIITLEVRREKEDDGDWIILRVGDEGNGMTSEGQVDLFQIFTQADASNTRKYGGTGLRWAVSKHFAQMLGGTLNLDGVFGKGQHFTVRLPARIAAPQPETRPTVASSSDEVAVRVPDSPAENGLILVIDDDDVVREILEVYLSKIGYKVALAAGGEEGLKLAKQLRPDAITLDVMMPDIDGWEVLSKLKAEPELAHIPVIMLTMTEDKEIGYSLGAADYIKKPVPRTQLINVLRKYRAEKAPSIVMVVEDDTNNREMMVRWLHKVGWQVIEAENGEIAWQHLQKEISPDLILLNLIMPKMDGFEFITHLRQHDTCSSIPVVVFITKELTVEDRLWLNNHADMVLKKGAYHSDELLAELSLLLVSKHSSNSEQGDE